MAEGLLGLGLLPDAAEVRAAWRASPLRDALLHAATGEAVRHVVEGAKEEVRRWL